MIITKREILISVIIATLMLCFGLFINSIITEHRIKKDEVYNKALKITEDENMFKYALDTSIGNVIVYGNFEAQQSVTFPNLSDSYLMVEQITEEYHEKTRVVCTGSDDDRECRTETYYEWDEIKNDVKHSDKIRFNGILFDYNKFGNYNKHILQLSENNVKNNKISKIKNNCIYDVIRVFGSNVDDKRYCYKVIDKSFNGTIFAKASKSDLISEDVYINIYYEDIDSFLERESSYIYNIIFWVFYIVLCSFVIYYYLSLDNNYLED